MDQFTGLGVFVDTYPNADRLHDVSQPQRADQRPELWSCTGPRVGLTGCFRAEVVPVRLRDAGERDAVLRPRPRWEAHRAGGVHGAGAQRGLRHLSPRQILQKQTQGTSVSTLLHISSCVFSSYRSYSTPGG